MVNKLQSLLKLPSLLVIITILIFVPSVHNNQKPWSSNSVIKYDVVNYYSYLPATLIESQNPFIEASNIIKS